MKKHDKAGKHPFTVSIRGQLMLFIGGITLFTLLLVWSIITFALEPQYNRTIRAKLDGKAAAITAMIDQADPERRVLERRERDLSGQKDQCRRLLCRFFRYNAALPQGL